MAVTSGFFNSLNGDRKYSAEDFGKLFTGIFSDGILKNVGGELKCTPSAGNKVNIASGRAWFGGFWLENSSTLSIDLGPSESVLNRYDAVVVSIDKRNRIGTIKVIKGSTSSTNPSRPNLTNNNDIVTKPLCYVYRPKGSSSISSSNISNQVGTSTTPYAKSLASIHDSIVPSEIPTESSLNGNSVVLVGGSSGPAKKMGIKNFAAQSTVIISQVNRNSLFRGNKLGSSVSSSQLKAIKDGHFTDLYIGDYWEISGKKYRIAHFNYYKKVGGSDNQAKNKNHVLIVPDFSEELWAMHNGSYLSNGFYGSQLRGRLSTISLRLSSHFPNMLRFTEYVSSGMSNNQITSSTSISFDLVIPSEIQVYGNTRATRTQTGHGANSFSVASQFALFRLDHSFIMTPNNVSYWTRDAVTSSHFSNILGNGSSNNEIITNNSGVRPYFLIG